MALQHLRSSTANKRPVPGNMSDGQLSINTNTASPGLFFKDSNNTLVKVGPVHVGTTAPNASPASGGTAGNSVGEQWLDTTGGTYVFKVWDGSAWRSESGTFVDVNGDVMTGALGIIAGSAGAPGLYFSGDTNTGIYSPGADQVAISTNGTGRLFVDASGNVGIGTSATTETRTEIFNTSNSSVTLLRIGSNNTGNTSLCRLAFNSLSTGGISLISQGLGSATGAEFLAFGTNNTERMRLDSSGRLGVGTSSPSYRLTVDNINEGVAGISLNGNDQSNARIRIANGGASGRNWELTAGLTGANNSFFSIYDQTATSSRLVIDDQGRVGIGTTSPAVPLDVAGNIRTSTGILFGADTAAANELDDYEEGTFTPTIVGTSTAGTATYGSNGQQGRYTKIGNRVFFDLYLAWSAHTGTGDLQITGLPFTVQNTTNLNRTFSAIFSNVALTAGSIGAAFSAPNTTTILLRQMPTGGGAVATIPMDTSAQISISGSFDV